MGPICPVVQAGQACPDAPYPANLTVTLTTGKIVARALAAEPSSGGPFPASAGYPFSVMEGVWTRLDVTLDSGIR